jgi:hypothetical protein
MGLAFAINLSIELSINLEIKGVLSFMSNVLFVILGQVGICGVRILTNI